MPDTVDSTLKFVQRAEGISKELGNACEALVLHL